MGEVAKKLNLRMEGDQPLDISPDSIPNLVPADYLNKWMEGDETPYFKIQEIAYPLVANGYNYTEKFFKSYISKLKKRPIPGARLGHEMGWGKRAVTDLLLVGAKFNSNGDGSGTVLFKNYIPPVGESGDNTVFIKENKTNMIEFSLISYTKDEREEHPDGSVTWNVIESMFGERNDAVAYGEGAMTQKTNNRDDDVPDNKRGENMGKKQETLDTLLTLKNNAELSLAEVAKHLGLEDQLVTDEQREAVVKLNAIQKLTGEKDPVEFINEALDEVKQNAIDVRAAKLNEAFGPVEFEDTKKANKARVYADQVIGDAELTEEKINEIKESDIFKALAAERADSDSDVNQIGVVESKKNKDSKGPKVVEY